MAVLDVDLYTSANAFVTNLGDCFNRSFRHQHGDVGAGQVTLDLDDGDLASCTRKRILKFKVDGTIRFAAVIGPRTQSTVGPDERASKMRTVGGQGVDSLMANAPVLPELGVGLLSPQQRGFGAMSADYDDAAWIAATELYRQDSTPFGYGPLWPEGWKDTTAFWIWSQMFDAFASPPLPVGKSYFRKVIDVPEDGEVVFDIAADDAFRFWLDAEFVTQQNEAFAWKRVTSVTRYLTAGAHTIYVECENLTRANAATNFAGLIMAIYTTFAGGDIDTIIDHTDSTWLALDYPAEAPTMLPGALVKILLDEAHFFGQLAEVTQGAWTEAVDENGVPWAQGVDISVSVGATLLDVLRILADIAIDWLVDPDTLELRLYNKGTLAGASGVTLTEGDDYVTLEHADYPDPPTGLLVRLVDGRYTLVASGAGGQPVVAYLEAGSAASPDQATRAAEAVFAVSPETLTAVIDPDTGDLYDDMRPGSTFTTVNMAGAGDTWRLTALTCADRPANEDGTVGGEPIFAIEAVAA